MDIKNTQKSVEENLHRENSTELIHREKLENTPLEIVGNKEKGYWIAFGKYKISDTFQADTKKTDESWNDYGWRILNTDQWNIIANMMVLFNEFAKLDLINWLQKNKKNNTTKTNKKKI